MASIIDLTQRKRGEELELQAHAQVEETHRLEAIGQFRSDLMNMVAHELKNPLTPIRAGVAMVMAMPQDAVPDQARRALAIIERNAKRLTVQIDQMVEASRLESGTARLTRTHTDVQGLVQEACESFRPVAQEAGVTLTWSTQPALPALADADRVVQVLNNLVSNAIKYTPEGGRVDIQAARWGSTIRVEVRDTGLGLTPPQMQRLFQPFSRVQDPVRKNATASGLGLYISKGIVTLHGGELGVASEGPGAGSTFWFTLPDNP